LRVFTAKPLPKQTLISPPGRCEKDWKRDVVFKRAMDAEKREKLISGRHKAAGRSRDRIDRLLFFVVLQKYA
jgi:hypothetical protein